MARIMKYFPLTEQPGTRGIISQHIEIIKKEEK